MCVNIITEQNITDFRNYLRESEKASLTIEKYVHAIRELMLFLEGTPLSKTVLLNFREHLQKTTKQKQSTQRFQRSTPTLIMWICQKSK